MWELRAQRLADLETMPVEDASAIWPEDGSLYRPLGSIMRARRETYPRSAGFRSARNGCPIHEPASLAWFVAE